MIYPKYARHLSRTDYMRIYSLSAYTHLEQMRFNLSIRPLMVDNTDEPLIVNGRNVYGVFKGDLRMKTPYIYADSFYGDENFYSCVDYLINVEHYEPEDALSEVYMSFTASDITSGILPIELSENFLKFLQPEQLENLKPKRCSYQEWDVSDFKAKIRLIKLFQDSVERKYLSCRYNIRVDDNYISQDPKLFVAPASLKSCNVITKFLIEDMNFSVSFIKWLIDKHMIYEDIQHNLILPGFDEDGHILYAYQHSSWFNTSKGHSSSSVPLDQVVPHSTRKYSWRYINSKSRTLYIFENIFSMLSYMNIMNLYNIHFPEEKAPLLEMSSFIFVGTVNYSTGIPDGLAYVLASNPQIKKIVICFDSFSDAAVDIGSTSASILTRLLSKDKERNYIISQSDLASYDNYFTMLTELKQEISS